MEDRREERVETDLEANPQGPRRNSTGLSLSLSLPLRSLLLLSCSLPQLVSRSRFFDRVLTCSDTKRLQPEVITSGPRCSLEEPSDKNPRLNANASARP